MVAKLNAPRRDDGPVVIDQISSAASQPQREVNTDTRQPARLGLWALLIGFGGFMLWATLAPLASGVPTQGTVAVESERKTVQHYTGGVIDEILVREGQSVKAGEVLVRMNPTRARAELAIVQSQYYTAQAVEDRLMAEYLNLPAIRFNSELLQHRGDAAVAEIMSVQSRLFATRRAAQERETATLKESADALEAQLKGMRDLAAEGYLPRNRMLDAERTYAEIKLRMLQQEHEYRKQVETMLGDAQKDASNLRDRMLASQQELDRAEIKAPVSGMVMALTVNTVGGVVQPGGHILDIVPEDEPLIVEAMIPTHLIDQVHVNMAADLRFSAFNQSRTPVIEGKVVTVSADRLSDPATHQPYYLARITVPPEQAKRLGGNRIQAGMPVEVIVKGEARTFMSYLLKPLMDRLASSLKER